ncbi:hypothetical protein [Haladaptatus salinisoli]|uniref:hypothetical protein n=1 Tax=Haladaptatus salinisoli TaxID=2884876 RepID=UPI001D0AF17C|nr:hypothetical protein [Haladaptatus salinisoli]
MLFRLCRSRRGRFDRRRPAEDGDRPTAERASGDRYRREPERFPRFESLVRA